MKTLSTVFTRKKIAALLTLVFGVYFDSHAQQQKKTDVFAGDTVTYILYASDLDFDHKRAIVYDDKSSVDSLVNALIADGGKQYHIVYKKEGEEAHVVSTKYLKGLDRSGCYRVTIAYNKPQATTDPTPLYVINSK